MTAYLLTALGVIFLTVIVGIVAPEGKLQKSVNFVLRLVCVCVLISPVARIFDFAETKQTELTDYSFVCSVYAKSQSESLKLTLKENYGIDCECDVSVVFEDGEIKEKGVAVYVDLQSGQTIENIREYLSNLGYINITVNEKTD